MEKTNDDYLIRRTLVHEILAHTQIKENLGSAMYIKDLYTYLAFSYIYIHLNEWKADICFVFILSLVTLTVATVDFSKWLT